MGHKCNFETVTLYGTKPSRPTIGVFKNSDIGYSCFQVQWEALVAAAQKYDVNLICYAGGQIACGDLRTFIFDLVSAERLDGLLIWTGNINWHAKPEAIEAFIKSYVTIPVISIETPVNDIPSLVWDDCSISRVLTHLIEDHHCKRIAFVRGHEGHDGMERRFQTYLQVLAEHGIGYDPEIVFPEKWLLGDREELQKLKDRLAAGAFDGLAGSSDWLAWQIVNIMEEMGLPPVPFVGFDDDIEGRVRRPTLTTIRPPFVEIGYRAVERLLEMIAGNIDTKTECLPCSTILRRSCGCGSPTLQLEERREKNWHYYDNCHDIQVGIDTEAFEKRVDGLAKIPRVNVPDWKANLLKVFLEELQAGTGNLFINYFENLLDQTEETSGHFENWKDIVLALYSFTKPLIKDCGPGAALAEKLVQQGIMLIDETVVRTEISKKMVEGSRQLSLLYFNRTLGSPVDLDELLDQIFDGAVKMGILGFYLAMFEQSELSNDQARLILACDENGVRLTQAEGLVYPARQLVPDGILPVGKRFCYLVMPICFQNRKFGFMLYRANPKYLLSDYVLLSDSIGITLNDALLIKELSTANTNLENAYQALQENQEKLLRSETMASLGRLTAGIAHEMNTPQATICIATKELGELVCEYQQSIGNAQVMPEDHQSIAADMVKQIQLIEQASAKNTEFIKGIKAQTLDLKLTNLQWFNAALVIKDALNVLEFALRKGLCRLVTDLDDSIRLYGDPRRLVQVITNLVMNGIDACKPDGGVITVTLANGGEGFAEILVQDTGCGIPQENLSRIFDPMFTTKPFGEGTGLGLSIVHDLLGEYRGTIGVNSRKGMTAFKIRLPLNNEA